MNRNIFRQSSTAGLLGLSIAVLFALNIGGLMRTADAQCSALSPHECHALAGQAYLERRLSPYEIQESNRLLDLLGGVLGSAAALQPSYVLPGLGPYFSLIQEPIAQNPGEFNPQDYSVGYQYGYQDGSFRNPMGYSYGYVNPYSQSFQIGYNDGYEAGFTAVTGLSPFSSPFPQ